MAKKLVFYEGEEAQKRFEEGMKKFLNPSKAAKVPYPKRPQSSAK